MVGWMGLVCMVLCMVVPAKRSRCGMPVGEAVITGGTRAAGCRGSLGVIMVRLVDLVPCCEGVGCLM